MSLLKAINLLHFLFCLYFSKETEVCDALYQHLCDYLCSSSTSNSNRYSDGKPSTTITTSDLPWQQPMDDECVLTNVLPYSGSFSDDCARSERFFEDVLMEDDNNEEVDRFEQFVDLKNQLQFNYNDINLNTLTVGKSREQTPSSAFGVPTTTKANSTADDVDKENGDGETWDSLLNSMDSDIDGHLNDQGLFSYVKDHLQSSSPTHTWHDNADEELGNGKHISFTSLLNI